MTSFRLLSLPSHWTRRDWFKTVTAQTGVFVVAPAWHSLSTTMATRRGAQDNAALHSAVLTPDILEPLAQRAVDAARSAGATYADARLTRVTTHVHLFGNGFVQADVELVAMGVRALVNGYWGFVALPLWASQPDAAETVVRMARDAVAQARVNAKGSPRTVELGHVPVATGRWVTPMAIDPFSVPLEEKMDAIRSWVDSASRSNLLIDTGNSWIQFVRQERVVATSEGAHFTQTCYESGGQIVVKGLATGDTAENISGIDWTGKGWELFLDAKIPDQLATIIPGRLRAAAALAATAKPLQIGRRTLVCDGATMAAIVEQTVGVATQLDRALGYEANAGGTSFLDDPLAMLGRFQLTTAPITITANRTTPTDLATVKWDDEGVTPPLVTLIKKGVLTDFQTTREQAAWLAPYYSKVGRPIQSNGCAGAEDAGYITLQHMPNLALEPSATGIELEDLVATVKDGVLIENGGATSNSQATNGMLFGAMRQITNGRLGRPLFGGAVSFNTVDLWKHVELIGGAPSSMVRATSQYGNMLARLTLGNLVDINTPTKGQPGQRTSHTVRAAAAVIANQPFIDPTRKA